MTLDIDHPRWRKNLDRMEAASRQIAAAKARGGLGGMMSRLGGMVKAATAFISVFTIPAKTHRVPISTRMEPTY
jgi:magnesium-protoporphyrin IX monomethyl ester (oxidative) cyclase